MKASMMGDPLLKDPREKIVPALKGGRFFEEVIIGRNQESPSK
jgi:hypothetical protein